ncbi:hypothetical protein PAMP_011724 [Pampus punctatissimus]
MADDNGSYGKSHKMALDKEEDKKTYFKKYRITRINGLINNINNLLTTTSLYNNV